MIGPETVATIRKVIADESAGNSRATMTDLDFAVAIMDQVLRNELFIRDETAERIKDLRGTHFNGWTTDAIINKLIDHFNSEECDEDSGCM